MNDEECRFTYSYLGHVIPLPWIKLLFRINLADNWATNTIYKGQLLQIKIWYLISLKLYW